MDEATGAQMIHALDLFGTAVFAVTGALAAGRKHMDIFGVAVVALVTAIGGGTIRDVVLGVRPVLWVLNPIYVTIAIVAALGTFATAHYVRMAYRVLLLFDAIGLAVFTVIGCERAATMHVSGVIVIVMGIVTGVAGGIIRDLLCDEIPLVLHREIYAVASLLGGAMFVVMAYYGLPRSITVLASAGVVLAVRLIAIHRDLSLPVMEVKDER